MDVLNRLVASLSREEVRHFKMYLSRIATPDDRKDDQLFSYIRTSRDKFSDEKIHRKLYGKAGRNNYYRLKNRLLEMVSANLALLHSGKDKSNRIHQFLSLFNIFYARNDYYLANFFLKKAERQAIALENYELLDLIYAGFIRLSNNWIDINPETYIARRKENTEKLTALREMDQVIAAVHYRVMKSQNYGTRDAGLMKLLNKTIREYSANEQLRESKQFQTRMYAAVSQQLLQNHNYRELETFCKESYQTFTANRWFDRHNHETHLQMLIYIINSLFRNGRYAESLRYTDKLKEQLTNFNRMSYDKYFFFYYNALVINYSETNLQKALDAVNELDRELKNKKGGYYEQFVLMNRAIILYRLGRFSEAIRNLVRLYVSDNYRKADPDFQLRIVVAEVMMHFESGENDTTILRLEQVRKQYAEALKNEKLKSEAALINLIGRLVRKPDFRKDAQIMKAIEQFKKMRQKEQTAENEVINYREWMDRIVHGKRVRK